MRIGGLAAGFAAIGFIASPARALETDQFYAWTRPLEDATDAINTKINAEIAEALAQLNARHSGGACSCLTAAHAIHERFEYPIIARPELWATKTSLVDRVPATADEESRFRHAYLYGAATPIDPLRWMPASPTIEVAGVRFGTDKLGHFFSDGAWVANSYRRALKHGAGPDDALRHAVRKSLATERGIWGRSSSGILSLADLEANYQGMVFYRGLCDGPDPALTRSPEGWRLARPFDLAPYVTPEWDESWQPNIYTAIRWPEVRSVMEGYCPLLHDARVVDRRAAYAARDRQTPTEKMVRALVASGKLADPKSFTIESVCAATPAGGSHAP